MRYIITPVFLLFFAIGSAQVRLPKLISDNMVLQRDQPLHFWGWAGRGEKVQIAFAGQSVGVTADTAGNWSAILKPVKAGGPYIIHITASNQLEVKNVLVGDVWFCSGQSNMVLNMERVKEKYPEEIAAADYPEIRNFFVPTAADLRTGHTDMPGGEWLPTSPKTVYTFGAAAYFFAKDLYQRYRIPIGIINSSVGGTPIEAWISPEGIAGFPDQVAVIKRFLTGPQQRPARSSVPQGPKDDIGIVAGDLGMTSPVKWYEPGLDMQGWKKITVPGYWADQGIRGLNGVVWYRKDFDLPASMTGTVAKLFIGRIVDADQAYINGVQVGNITYQYPPRRYEVPARLLHTGKNTLVVRISSFSGKGGMVPDKPYYIAAKGDTIDLRGEWHYKVGQVFVPRRGEFQGGQQQQNMPTGLYNTMVQPAIPYPVRGFVWYQGETNTGNALAYRHLLPALISDWRNKWENGKSLPFLFVQLPNFMDMQYLPSESNWAMLREAQLMSLAVPNTAMAVTIDCGEWNDIHPLDKKDVGDRLALAAEKLSYGETNLVASGPLFASADQEGDRIRLHFSNTGGGLVAKGPDDSLHYFAIAGADKHFVWAHAKIEHNTVVVWSNIVPEPKYVRYAWADNPDGANLYNKEGLPASPFRTDQ